MADPATPLCFTEAERFLKAHGLDPHDMHDEWFSRYILKSTSVSAICNEALARSEYIQRFGFAIIDRPTINAIRPYAPLVEIGAGSGYWTHELTLAGIDVIATDPGTTTYHHDGLDNEFVGRWKQLYAEVEPLDGVQAIHKYPDRNVLMVWPDLARWPARVLFEFYKHSKAEYVLYVGEGMGGCTANHRFFRLLDRMFEEAEELSIPKFSGLHDHLEVRKRRKTLE